MNQPKPTGKRSTWIWTTILLVLLAVAGFRLLIVGAEPKLLERNTELLVDDFGFSVTDEYWAGPVVDAAGHPVVPQGRFLVVEVHVDNQAKRVDFMTRPDQFTMISDDGKKIKASISAQEIVDADGNNGTKLAAGESSDRKIIFDVPADSKNLQMKIVFGGRIGEILDWLLFGERAFEINP